MRQFIFFVWLVTAICLMRPALAQKPTSPYVPAQTTVAILPVLNQSRGDWQGLKDRQTEKAQTELARRFAQSGFSLADTALVANALGDQNLPPGNPAAYTPPMRAETGRASDADLVAFLVITDSHQGFRHGLAQLLGQQREGEAKVQLWLVDTRTGMALVNGQTASGKARGNALANTLLHGIGQGGSDYVIRAVGDAVGQALRGFLQAYPDR